MFLIIFYLTTLLTPQLGRRLLLGTVIILTGNLCEKIVTQLGIEPSTFGLPCQRSTPELSDHTDGWTCNSHKLPMVQLVPTHVLYGHNNKQEITAVNTYRGCMGFCRGHLRSTTKGAVPA